MNFEYHAKSPNHWLDKACPVSLETVPVHLSRNNGYVRSRLPGKCPTCRTTEGSGRLKPLLIQPPPGTHTVQNVGSREIPLHLSECRVARGDKTGDGRSSRPPTIAAKKLPSSYRWIKCPQGTEPFPRQPSAGEMSQMSNDQREWAVKTSFFSTARFARQGGQKKGRKTFSAADHCGQETALQLPLDKMPAGHGAFSPATVRRGKVPYFERPKGVGG